MPKKASRTHIVVLLDRSGSMSSIREAMQEGLNGFVQEQRSIPGKCTLTLAQFDDQYEIVLDHVDINDAPPIILSPRGSTALLDSWGQLLTDERKRVSHIHPSKFPTHRIVCIITDGHENASREWSKPQVFELTRVMEAEGWVITYLGANQDAIQVGASYGTQQANTMTYAASDMGTRSAMSTYSAHTSTLRSTGAATPFTEAERVASSTV